MTLSGITDSRYLEFVRVDSPDRKTPVVMVRSKSSGFLLGRIAWFGRWRQFCFWPSADTVFNTGCMADIERQITALREERNDAIG